MPWIVAGLGNPGPGYSETRHNAGFMTVDVLARRHGASYWKDEADAVTASVRVAGADVVLAKPRTFMNRSGRSIKGLATIHDAAPEDFIVVHDDIDLPEGDVRAKASGGHGGHNGLRSIHEVFADGGYRRVRVGVGRPPGRMDPADWVLQRMRPKETEGFAVEIAEAADCVEHIIEHGIESAMRAFNAS